MAHTVWSDALVEFVRQNAGRMKDWQVAAALSRVTGGVVTRRAVEHVRQNLGIRKRRGRGLCEVVSRREPLS